MLQPSLLLVLLASFVHDVRSHQLPQELLSVPTHLARNVPRLAGTYTDEELADLRTKPRAFIGYVSDKDWSFIEFLCMFHASWRYITGLEGVSSRFKLDVFAFVHPRWAKEVGTICEPMDLGVRTPWMHSAWHGTMRTCCA